MIRELPPRAWAARTEPNWHQRALDKLDKKQSKEFETVSDNAAGSKNFTRNFKVKQLEDQFPHNAKLRSVSKHYANAVGGPLYVDEVSNELSKMECLTKQKSMKRLGLRHIVLEENTTLYEAMDQLGET